jgi:AcrR family transcriptional regulator
MQSLSAPERALRADAARNRERIIEAATEVFAEQGLEASTAEIAARAGVGEATLFRRFESKDELIVTIIETRMGHVLDALNVALERDDPGEALKGWLEWAVQDLAEDLGFFEAARDQCLVSPALAEIRREILARMTELLRRAQRAGAVRGDVAPQDLSFLISAAASATANMPVPGLRPDMWRRYLGIIVDGLRPDGATKLRPGPPPRRLFEQR